MRAPHGSHVTSNRTDAPRTALGRVSRPMIRARPTPPFNGLTISERDGRSRRATGG